jgi:hypothetical protein
MKQRRRLLQILLTGGVQTKQTRCDGRGCAEDPLHVCKQRNTLKSQIKSNQAVGDLLHQAVAKRM